MNEYYFFDLVSQEQKEKLMGHKWVLKIAFDGLYSFMKRGQVLAIITLYDLLNKYSKTVLGKIEIYSPIEGYYCKNGVCSDHFLGYYATENQINQIAWWDRPREYNQNPKVITVFKTYEELLCDTYVKYSINEDVFLHIKVLSWISSYELYDDEKRPSIICSFEGNSDRAALIIKYWDFNSMCKYLNVRSISKIYFLLDADTFLSFKIDKKLAKFEKNECADFRFDLNLDSIESFRDKLLKRIRIETIQGETCDFVIKEQNAKEFQFIFGKFIDALADCGFDLIKDETVGGLETCKKDEVPTSKANSCHVYLMHDESNGFYKIGISNKPEYREHTLQSEKPTIVLVCSKEFPNRSIAEAFEAALHKVYENKRLRGEWFKLDDSDVQDLIVSLS